ncbi:MAG: 1-acyl-sn-glycerol-3-phosphate acyltransferase [Bacteroidales bacterium]|jgi:1-acyl-sn-glycerol-3-phosphate acyltransferase|nr:1-acyl-sn-glycerol-3-phosphate acyltransferase [Bacteroidales bacterium]
MENTFTPIDIKALFAEKDPRMARLVPGFVYRYLTRVMHIPEINEIMGLYGHLEGMDFIEKIIEYFNVTQNVRGIENVPTGRRYVFAANHPLGGFDSMLLMSNVFHHFGDFRILVNDIMLKIAPLRALCIPIDKYGPGGRQFAHVVNAEYSSDRPIIIFPSGLASRKTGGQIRDLQWKKHFIQKAIEFGRDVVPVHISGRNTEFFYRLANIRKALHIKWNLEIFFLPDETFRHRNGNYTLTFGKPIPYATFDRSHSFQEWAEYVKKMVYSLPESHN